MGVIQIKDNIYSVGVLDPKLRVFDIIMETTHGSTYNSYLIKTADNKAIIIDGVKEPFSEEWLENIKSLVKPEEISAIIVNHTEPDHSGSIKDLIEINPDIKVFGSFLALKNLENITNRELNKHQISDGEEYKFEDVTLRFIVVPNVHWPDTIITYYVEKNVAFTCDFLGEHYCPPSMFLSEIKNKENYDYAFQYYFDTIMGPFKKDVRTAIGKLNDLDVDAVYPSHGPFLDEKSAVMQGIRKYSTWSITKRRIRPKITIAYVSSYGYTRKLAETMAKEINKKNVDLFVYDLQITKIESVAEEIANSDGILIGSPTFIGDALKNVYDLLNSLNPFLVRGKLFTAFGSYGWSGEAVPNLLVRAKQLRMVTPDEGFRVKLNPSEQELEEARAFAEAFLQKVRENFKI
ncbi:MAG: FprA family A-type flavoprotein [Bacilli bacterium]|jgi:flavorubredoxin